MVVNLHFQFAKKEPKTITIDVGDGVRQGDTVWLNTDNRRKIREAYSKVFHRSIGGVVFTFHFGKIRPQENLDGPANRLLTVGVRNHSFNYESGERYRLIIPTGTKKHLWTNGRRARIFRHRRTGGGIRW